MKGIIPWRGTPFSVKHRHLPLPRGGTVVDNKELDQNVRRE